MGVRRAVDIVFEASNRYTEPIYTFGPLIHNPQVMALLGEKGISVIDSIPKEGSGIVIIRAHGVPPDTVERLEKAGFKVIDATCPRVIKVQTIIARHFAQGFASIIIGDSEHPEVVGLMGYAGDKGVVVNSLEGVKQLPVFEKAIVVAQTTQSTALFEQIRTWIEENHPHYKVFNTICPSTRERQTETARLAGEVDAMVVVGGYTSGNTRRLASICTESGKPVFHVETSEQLDKKSLGTFDHVGVTAGASTPDWIIKDVCRELEAAGYRSGGTFARLWFAIERMLLMTNIYLAAGAGLLCYCASLLRRGTPSLSHVLIAMLYIFSMHTLNRLTGTDEDRYNNPSRALFYNRHMKLMAVLAIGAGGAGLLIAFSLGLFPFLLLLVMSILGLSYNLYLVPERFSSVPIRRIKDIPASKTVLISLAWGVAVCAFPAAAEGSLDMSAIFTTGWLAGMVFVRSAFFDIMDMQGDRIVGKETLPILIGADRTIRFLKYFLVLLFLSLLAATVFGLVSRLGYLLLTFPVISCLFLALYEKDAVYHGLAMEFLVESQFILVGIVCLLWSFMDAA